MKRLLCWLCMAAIAAGLTACKTEEGTEVTTEVPSIVMAEPVDNKIPIYTLYVDEEKGLVLTDEASVFVALGQELPAGLPQIKRILLSGLEGLASDIARDGRELFCVVEWHDFYYALLRDEENVWRVRCVGQQPRAFAEEVTWEAFCNSAYSCWKRYGARLPEGTYGGEPAKLFYLDLAV